MAEMSFLINDTTTGGSSPVLKVTITENADGSVSFAVTQLAGYVGDLRGLFFDVADESLVGHLSATGTGLTEFVQGNDSVTDLGGGSNMNGLLGGDSGYDVGVEIGSSGLKGTDDYRSFAFTLTSDARALTLQDFSNVSFGARVTSVGLDSNLDGTFETSRTLSSKTGETTFQVLEAHKDEVTVTEDASLTGNVLANDGAPSGDTVTVTGWSGGQLGVAYAVQELGLATITVNADGSYVVDASAADGLAAGESLSHVFTYDVLQVNAEGTSTHTVSFKVTVTGTNDAPVIAGSVFTGAIEELGSNADTGVLQASGSIGFDDLDLSDTHTVSFVAEGSTLGTLSALAVVDAATGAGDGAVGWTYSVDADKVAYLAAGEQLVEEFTVTVTDENGGTDTATVHVTVTGTNDAPVIDGSVFTGAIEELGSNVDTGVLEASGSIAFDDADLSDTHIVSFAAAGTTLGTLSALAVTDPATGAGDGTVGWTYSVDADKVAYLAAGEQLVEEFAVTITDANGGTDTATVHVTVTGTNDAPVIDGSIFTGAIEELGSNADTGVLEASGSIAFDDADLSDTHTVSFAPAGTTLGTLSALAIADAATGAGAGAVGWTYSVDADKVAHLAAGEQLVEEFTVTVTDENGATDTAAVRVTVTGTNDAPVIDGAVFTGAIEELGSNADTGVLEASGSIAFDDADLSDTHTVSFAPAGTTLGTLSALAIADAATGAGAGAVGWTYSVDADKVAYLAAGEQLVEEFTVRVTDENGGTDTATVRVTVSGTNDAPVIDGAVFTGAIEELGSNADAGVLGASGIIAFDDADLTDTHTVTFAPAGSTLGTLSALAVADPATGAGDGTLGWTYSVDADKVAYLAAGEQLIEEFTVTVIDVNGGTDTATVRVTVSGTNDAPVIDGSVFTGAIEELGSNADAGVLGASGIIAFDDADLTDTHTVTFAPAGPTLGTLSALAIADVATGGGAGAVGWTYSVDADKVAYLAAGEQLVEEFTVTVTDENGGTDTATVRVTVSGTNDAPVIDGAVFTGAIEELGSNADTGVLEATGSIAFDDADLSDMHTVSFAPAGTTLGTLSALAIADPATGAGDGTLGWTYSVDADKVAYLAAGEQLVEEFTVTVTDATSGTETATVRVTLTGTNDAPVIDGSVFTSTIDEPGSNADTGVLEATGSIAFDDADLTDTHTVSFAPAGSTLGTLTALALTDAATGVGAGSVGWTYSVDAAKVAHLAAGEQLVEEFTVTLTDDQGLSQASTVRVVVTGTNDAPVATPALIATNAGQSITGQLGATDADGSDVLSFSVVDGPAHGQLQLDEDGNYAYVPGSGFSGADAFTYEVKDASGASSVATAEIEVASASVSGGQVRYIDQIPKADIVSAPVMNNWPGAEVTALADGGHVVVWAAYGGSAADTSLGVYQLRYDAEGNKVGSPTLVNTTTASDQYIASVAANGEGWVVVWSSYGQDGSEWGVYQQRFGADGAKIGGEVLVNQTTYSNQLEASVGELAGGGYVVSWNGYNTSTGTYEIYARAYNADGSARTGEFVVNANTANYQYTDGYTTENVIGLSGGGFVVVWRDHSGSQDNSGAGVVARVYDASGAAITGDLLVNTMTSSDQLFASVASVGSGFVVTWSSYQQDGSGYGIYAQRFAADGSKIGSEFRANTATFSDQLHSKAVELQDGGFVVVWQSYNPDGSNTWQISGQRYDSAGNAVNGEFVVNGISASMKETPSVAVREDGALVVTWRNGGAEIEQKVIDDFAQDTHSAQASSDEIVSNPIVNNYPGAEVTSLADGGHVVVWSAYSGSAADTSLGVYQQRYDAQGHKVGSPALVNTTTASDQYIASVAANGNGWVVVWGSYGQDGSDWGVFQQRFAANGSKIGGEVLVNQTTYSTQMEANVGELADGGYVVSWNGYNTSTGSYEVYARAYNADGSARTGEFVVDAHTANYQYTDAYMSENVIGLSGGGFVVVWRDFSGALDSSGGGIVARVYSASGAAITGDVLVNTTTVNEQFSGSVAALENGFVVTWSSYQQDGSGYGIYAQRFAADGSKLGSEFRANSATLSDQLYSKAVQLDDGGFVIVWQSYNPDGSNAWQISGQRYDSEGNAVNGEFIVNGFTGGQKEMPSITAREDGALVVTWRNGSTGAIEEKVIDDFAQDTRPIQGTSDEIVSTPIVNNNADAEVTALADGGHVVVWSAYSGSAADTNQGVYQQRYDAAGHKVGAPTLVNTTTASDQYIASVAANGDGWVVTWSSYGQDGSDWGVYLQRFGANGAKIGGEVLVNQTTSSTQIEANVGELAGGGYVVSWNGYNTATGTYDIYARAYNADGSARTGEFVVNAHTANYQYTDGFVTENVIGLSGGGFVVVWRDYSGALDTSSGGIIARVYDASGAAVTGDVLVNTTTLNDQFTGSVAALDNGFVVTWTSYQQDGSGYGVYAQRFTADGSKIGSEFQVNTWAYSSQLYAKAVQLDDGGFVVVWQSFGVDGSGTWEISGQRYDSEGNAVNGEFIVNSISTAHKELPSLALRDDGALIVTWHSSTGSIQEKIITDFGSGGVQPKDLVGTDGNDSFLGSAGHDTLAGAAGDDRIDGLGGSDLLTGGDGADTFVFSTAPGGDNVDQVADFTSGVDHFELVDSGSFAALPLGELAAGAFDVVGDASAQTADTRVIYDPSTGAVFFDADGSGAQAAQQVAVLTNLPPTLQAGDFIVVPGH